MCFVFGGFVLVCLLVRFFWVLFQFFSGKFVQYNLTFTEYAIERYQHNFKKQVLVMATVE